MSSVLTIDGRNAELQELRSDNGRFRFVVEDNCSLVLYMDSDAIWAMYETKPLPTSPDGAKLVVQSDGNLVVVHATHGPTWASETGNGGPGPYLLAMHNDGNCVLYDGGGRQRWSTKTCGWG